MTRYSDHDLWSELFRQLAHRGEFHKSQDSSLTIPIKGYGHSLVWQTNGNFSFIDHEAKPSENSTFGEAHLVFDWGEKDLEEVHESLSAETSD